MLFNWLQNVGSACDAVARWPVMSAVWFRWGELSQMVTNGPIVELGRSLRSLQTVAFLLVRRGDESSVAAAGAAHRPKPPHLNHTALKLGHLGVAWKHLSHSPRLLEALTSPSRPANYEVRCRFAVRRLDFFLFSFCFLFASFLFVFFLCFLRFSSVLHLRKTIRKQ